MKSPEISGCLDPTENRLNGLIESLGLFQRILLTTDGTVTSLLALYTGENIRVVKLSQHLERGGDYPQLAPAPNSTFLKRAVLLAGERDCFLYAQSIFIFERLSRSIQTQLMTTDKPIGLLWKEERTETFQETIHYSRGVCPEAATYFGLPAEAEMYSRTYVIYSAAKPFGMITETFPACYFLEVADWK